MPNETEVYRTELIKLGHGVPLYEPDPAGEYDQVRVGDVGYEDRFGRFHTIFNAFREANDPINTQFGTPANFSPLTLRTPATFFRNAMPAGAMHSTHVRVLGGGFGAAGSCVPSQAKIEFSISNHQGAVLVIKYPAFREDCKFENEMAKYMLKNHRSWLTFLRDELGCSVDLRDIVFVTGCDLTSDWATATFVEKRSQCNIEFKAGDMSIGAATASLWGTWQSSLNVPVRCGPGPVRPPSSSLQTITFKQPEAYNVKYDQCIFLRGFRVAERRILRSPFIMKAAAEPQDLDMDRDNDSAPVLLSVEDDNDDVSDWNESKEHQPLRKRRTNDHDRLMDFVLEHSDADIILVHDRDVCSFANLDVGSKQHDDTLDGLKRHLKVEHNPDLKIKVGLFITPSASVSMRDRVYEYPAGDGGFASVKSFFSSASPPSSFSPASLPSSFSSASSSTCSSFSDWSTSSASPASSFTSSSYVNSFAIQSANQSLFENSADFKYPILASWASPDLFSTPWHNMDKGKLDSIGEEQAYDDSCYDGDDGDSS